MPFEVKVLRCQPKPDFTVLARTVGSRQSSLPADNQQTRRPSDSLAVLKIMHSQHSSWQTPKCKEISRIFEYTYANPFHSAFIGYHKSAPRQPVPTRHRRRWLNPQPTRLGTRPGRPMCHARPHAQTYHSLSHETRRVEPPRTIFYSRPDCTKQHTPLRCFVRAEAQRYPIRAAQNGPAEA